MWEHSFDGLCSNKVNLFVAPNGYGKTTLTTAFMSAAHGQIKLNKKDYYQEDETKEPSLELEYTDASGTKTVITDETHGEISGSFTIFSIKNPIYAKSTGRNMGRFSSHSAELYIQDVEVCKIPQKYKLTYNFNKYKQKFGKTTPNLKEFFNSYSGLSLIINSKENFRKCIFQVRLQCLLNGITSENAPNAIENLKKNDTTGTLMKNLSSSYHLADEDAIRYLIQIVDIIKESTFELIQNVFTWLTYKKRKEIIDKRLAEFNTTGHSLSSTKHNNKLIISFGRADKMSNGERDVLSFVASLVSFESSLNKKPGILIMDEVFDYLDGTNLLAAHYYLSRMIEQIKSEKKIIFPIIMTHLDPAVFSNYCFKGMAVHYLTNKSSIIYPNDRIVKLLILRGILKEEKDQYAENLEKHLLHYHPLNWNIPDSIKDRLPDNFWADSYSFKLYLYSEIVDKYLRGMDYNSLAVIIGLRIKIEEKTVELLPENKREDYYTKFGSKNKLSFADECNADLPEIFYLLQPLYNDPAHLRSRGHGYEKENKNKIESAYLKLSSQIIKRMIAEVFE